MARFNGPTAIGAVALAVGVVLAGLLVSGLAGATPDFTGRVPMAFILIWTLGSMPIAFFMPRMRAGFFGRIWRVPATAYVVPRWMVRLLVGMTVGSAGGFFALAVLRDQRFYGLALSAALLAAAFIAGAWRRLGTPEKADFEMRWP